jgi:hypothetical protein
MREREREERGMEGGGEAGEVEIDGAGKGAAPAPAQTPFLFPSPPLQWHHSPGARSEPGGCGRAWFLLRACVLESAGRAAAVSCALFLVSDGGTCGVRSLVRGGCRVRGREALCAGREAQWRRSAYETRNERDEGGESPAVRQGRSLCSVSLPSSFVSEVFPHSFQISRARPGSDARAVTRRCS